MKNNRLNETKIGTASVIVDILPKGRVIPDVKITPTSITIHNTGNINTSAKNNHNYMKNCNKDPKATVASWHFTVDDKQIYQAQSCNFKCYHAGNSTGNNTSIGIEICMFNDAERQKQAYLNAIELVKILMNYYKFDPSKVKKHKDWSGKLCPQWLIQGKFGYTWSWFKNQLTAKTEDNSFPFLIEVVKCDTLNARKGPSTNYEVADTVPVGTKLTVVGESGNWYKTKSGLYISKSYCKFYKKL